MKRVEYYLATTECKIVIEETSKKEVLKYLDDYLERLVEYRSLSPDKAVNWQKPDEEAFYLLYQDGRQDRIDEYYDGHKIAKIKIATIVYSNPESSIVCGNYSVNEYGVVLPSLNMQIAESVRRD